MLESWNKIYKKTKKLYMFVTYDSVKRHWFGFSSKWIEYGNADSSGTRAQIFPTPFKPDYAIL